ncbi:MAG: hypothetical protein HY901_36585 [Deltaproteobacteria bacterium]|nr:hypothetical protein [Deltaproteobacteria bacterium]
MRLRSCIHRLLLLLQCFAPLLPLAGCMPEFQSAAEVIDRRILAIQVDPPELANGVPAPGSISVRALVADPTTPAATVSYEWRSCILEASTGRTAAMLGTNASGPTGRCDETDPATLIAAGDTHLGVLRQQAAVPPAALALLAEPEVGQPVMALRLQLKIASPGGDLYGIKDVVLTRALPPLQPPNANPLLTGISFDGTDLQPGDTVSVTWRSCHSDALQEVKDHAEDETVKVCSHTVRPLFDDVQSEPYQGKSYDGLALASREKLSFAFFTDHGSFSNATTTPPPAGTDPPDLGLQTRWREPTTKASLSTLWVVIRDGRGGESWSQYQVAIR